MNEKSNSELEHKDVITMETENVENYELDEREVTLKSGEVVTLDDIYEIDYIGKNHQVTLCVFFNPYMSSTYNEYTHKYEDYKTWGNQITLTPTIDDDYTEFPEENRSTDDRINIRIDIDNLYIQLPDFKVLFPSLEFGNYYEREAGNYGNHFKMYGVCFTKFDKNTAHTARIDDNGKYRGESANEGVIFASVKKLEWVAVVEAKARSG